MKLLVKLSAGLAFVAILALAAPSAMADTFNFNFAGNYGDDAIGASGIMTTTAASSLGVYNITNITGTVKDVGLFGALNYTGVITGPASKKLSYFNYAPDNQLHAGKDGKMAVDDHGLEFQTSGTDKFLGLPFPATFYVQVVGDNDCDDFFNFVWIDNMTGFAKFVPVSGSITPTPEPSSLLLLGTGLLGLAGGLYRKGKSRLAMSHDPSLA